MKKFNSFGLVVGTAIVGILIGSSAVSAETFVLNGNKALNTNSSFRLIDGHPRMSTWDHSLNDADQNFDRKSGGKGGEHLVHRRTGKCLNAFRRSNGAEVNVYPCRLGDADQNFNVESIDNGDVQIRVANTNFCIDNPNRINGGLVTLQPCFRNANQRFKINGGATPPPPPSGLVTLPFRSGETWYVCQGYRGTISHKNSFGLDLSTGQDFGINNACYGNQDRSANRPVLAPAAGKIYHIESDLVCLSIDNNRSMLIGHMKRSVANGATVNQGDVLGTTSYQGAANGYFSHIHLEGRKSAGCTPGTSVPLTAAYGFQLQNVGDLVGELTHWKRALTRP